MDIPHWLRFALNTEEKGMAFYSQCRTHAGSPAAEKLFDFLHSEEERHKRTILAIEHNQGPSEAARILNEPVEKCEVIPEKIPEGGALAEMLNMALAVERNSLTFYSRSAAAENDPHIRALLERLAKDEQSHFDIIKKFGMDLVGRSNL